VDVAAWLRGLRLEQYELAFRDNGGDAEILPKLTVSDLKDIGVTRISTIMCCAEQAPILLWEGTPMNVRNSGCPRTGT
jgi:hypothetical protein